MPRPLTDSVVSRWFIFSSHTILPHPYLTTPHYHEHFSTIAGRDIVPEPPSTTSSSSQHPPEFPIRGNASSLSSHNNTHPVLKLLSRQSNYRQNVSYSKSAEHRLGSQWQRLQPYRDDRNRRPSRYLQGQHVPAQGLLLGRVCWLSSILRWWCHLHRQRHSLDGREHSRSRQDSQLYSLPLRFGHDLYERCRLVHWFYHGMLWMLQMQRISVLPFRVLTSCPTKQLTGVACMQGRIPWYKMLLHWFICFWGNLCGALFVMAIIFGCKLPPSALLSHGTQSPWSDANPSLLYFQMAACLRLLLKSR